jgi:hypothetical protein
VAHARPEAPDAQFTVRSAALHGLLDRRFDF